MRTDQIEMVIVEYLLPEKHIYGRLKNLLDFDWITRGVKLKENEVGATGLGKLRLILQFMEDLSDREFERFIAENNAGKWFCGLGLMENPPDFTTVCKFRNLIGTKQMSRLFGEVKRQMQALLCRSYSRSLIRARL